MDNTELCKHTRYAVLATAAFRRAYFMRLAAANHAACPVCADTSPNCRYSQAVYYTCSIFLTAAVRRVTRRYCNSANPLTRFLYISSASVSAELSPGL